MNLYWTLQDAIDNGEIGRIDSKRLIVERVKRLIYQACRHTIPEVNDKSNIKVFVYKHPTKYHALITWISCTDHVADHARIT